MATRKQLTATIAVTTAALCRNDRGGQDGPGEAENTYGLPQGENLSAELKRWFIRQMREVIKAIPRHPIASVESIDLFKPVDWTDPMAAACVPLLSVEWRRGGQGAFERLGLDAEKFDVTSPHLKPAIEKAALTFCDSTNATTGRSIDTAIRKLRAELIEGMVEKGEADEQLTKRVQAIFENASVGRARRIAVTESSRAYHAAQEMAAQESGVVAGFELLLSGDACPLCRMVATECKRVKLGQPFAIIGHNPDYSEIRHPPIHPHCQCSLVEVISAEYGGPTDPKFDETLIQPKPPADGYKPPKGVPPAKPQPGRQDEPIGGKPKPPKAPRPAPPKPKPPKAPRPAPPKPKPPEQPLVFNPGPGAHPIATIPTAPKPPAGPTGKPVADALKLLKPSKTSKARFKWGEIDDGIAAIGRVHGDGILPELPVSQRPIPQLGVFRFSSIQLSDGAHVKANSIDVNPRDTTKRLTIVHELGHFLDASGIPGQAKRNMPKSDQPGGRDRYLTDPTMGGVMKAAYASPTVRTLEHIRAVGYVEKTVGTTTARVKPSPKYVDYLLDPSEVWARAYSQYIATRAGNAELKKELASTLDEITPRHWSDDEFKPIAAEIDAMFHKLGWRNP